MVFLQSQFDIAWWTRYTFSIKIEAMWDLHIKNQEGEL